MVRPPEKSNPEAFTFEVLMARSAELAVVVLGGGCAAVGPEYAPPDLPTPVRWEQPARSGVVKLTQWWEQFGDAHLSDLIKRASDDNRDLRVALDRIAESRSLLRVTAVQRFPDLDASGGATRGEASSAALGFPTRPAWTYDAGLSAGWEIDVFGRVRRAVEAATADFETVVEDYRSVMISLHADVALAYIEVRLAQRRLGIAQANVVVQNDALTFATNRHDAGLVSGLDLAQAESNIATTEASIPSLEADLDSSIHRLAVLLGSAIAPVRSELLEVHPIPLAPQELTVGLPADLLRNRPDLRAAERALAAETALVGVEMADLYPTFDVSAALGFESLELHDLLDRRARKWSAGASVFWDVFNFGGVQAEVEAQQARVRQALASYEQTLLLSVEEVENALAALRRERTRAEALKRAVVAFRRSVQLSQELYREGQTTFQNVLDAQRSLLDSEDQLAVSEAAIAQDMVGLFFALGGSWDLAEDVLSPRIEAPEK